MKTRGPVPTKEGFTLIELMVVIAIIGLLASIVLASLSTARGKAKDTAILHEINQLATLAELEYSENKSYTNLQKGWVPLSNTCATIPFTGNYATQARKICDDIIANTGTSCGTVGQQCFYSGITGVAPVSGNYGKYYAFMAYLPGVSAQTGVTTFACAGAGGGRYIGPINPGSGNWMGAGCYANP